MTGAEALRDAVAQLRAAGVEGAAGDARLLLAHALRLAPQRLTLALPDPLDPDAQGRFQALIARRAAREPVSHLIGRRWFWGREFIVTPDVLDPRPETETLVEQALGAGFSDVLDLGTGSGCILVSLLAERPEARGVGVDVSAPALAIAARNAQAQGVAARFVLSDWWQGVTGDFDLIVSNPPYIAQVEMAGLSPEVRDHEPHLALTPGGDGLGAYRLICAGLGAHLRPGGWLMVEIGWQQGAEVAAMLAGAGLQSVAVIADLGGHDRVVRGQRPAG